MTGSDSRRDGRNGERKFLIYLSTQNWIAIDTSDDDRGTDALAFLDASGRGSFASLAFQVKTLRRIDFKRTRDKGVGFTYRERPKHAERHYDYWVNHDIPHFLVVQTLDESVRIWQRLDRKNVRRTDGGGLSVFIPESNVVGSTPPARWLDVAARRAGQRYEAISRWEAGLGADIPHASRSRFALMVPRLVAAHPNQGPRRFSSTQALADVASSGDLWDRFGGGTFKIPTPNEAASHEDEHWRLAAAVRSVLDHDDHSLLNELRYRAESAAVRAAARAVLASRLIADARPLEAIEVAAQDDDFSPEDGHWLVTLRVEAYRSMGSTERLASEVGRGLSSIPELEADPTVRQLNASLLWAEFRSSHDFNHPIAEVLRAGDHAAIWWRDHHSSVALGSSTHDAFEAWSLSGRTRFGAKHSGHNNLVASAFQARLGGANEEARRTESLLCRLDVMAFETNAGLLHNALEGLLLSGDEDAVSDALGRCLFTSPTTAFDGLAETAIRALGNMDLHKSAISALRLLGPYLGDESRSDACAALVDFICDRIVAMPPRLAAGDLQQRALEAIYSLDDGLAPEDYARLVKWVQQLDSGDEFKRRALTSAMRIFDQHDRPVSDAMRESALRKIRSLSDESAQYWALVAAIGKRTRAGRSRLIKGLDAGRREAAELAHFITEFTPDQQRTQLAIALAHVERESAPGPMRGITLGGENSAAKAVQFAVALRDVDAIKAVLEYLADPEAQPQDKRRPALWIADALGDFPEIAKAQVEAAATAMQTQRAETDTTSIPFIDLDLGGAPERLLLALPDLDQKMASDCVTTLMRGNVRCRQDLANALAKRSGHDLSLVALSLDATFTVRAIATASIAYAAVTRAAGSGELKGALDAALQRVGPRVRREVKLALDEARENDNFNEAAYDEIRPRVAVEMVR